MKRILVIDALNAFVRAYSADPSTTPQQIPVGGVRGFLKILQKMIRITGPDRVFIMWDGEGGSQKRKVCLRNINRGVIRLH